MKDVLAGLILILNTAIADSFYLFDAAIINLFQLATDLQTSFNTFKSSLTKGSNEALKLLLVCLVLFLVLVV